MYDHLGRVIRRILPLGMAESFTYDASGHRVTSTNFNGDTTTSVYDPRQHLLTRTAPDGTAIRTTLTPTGQIAAITEPRGTTTYSYDLRDRVRAITHPSGTTIVYTYDAEGNRTSVTVPSGTTTSTYDALHRLTTVTDPQGRLTQYHYDPVGNRLGVAFPHGTSATATYDALHRLVTLEHGRHDGTLLAQYAYTLGATGQRTQMTEQTGATVHYSYDALSRLVREERHDPHRGEQTWAYTYDAVGNRLSTTDTSSTLRSTYDANDRLLTAGQTTYTYDANGNTLTRQEGGDTTTYTYDADNRLLTVRTPLQTIGYAYDAGGHRIRMTVDGLATEYVVDPQGDLAQVLEERDGTGALMVRYVYGETVLSQERQGATSYYHRDGLGSTRLLTDPQAGVTDTYTYDAFGNLLDTTGTSTNTVRFAGEQYDPSSGLYDLRARTYDPRLGRFIHMDPWPGRRGVPQSVHKYVYAHNNPVNMIDPSGMSATLAFSSTPYIASVGGISFKILLKFAAPVVASAATGYLLSQVAPLEEVGAVLSQEVDMAVAILAARPIMWEGFEQFRKSAEFKKAGKHTVELQLVSPPHKTTAYTIAQRHIGPVQMTIKGGGLGGRVFQFQYKIGQNGSHAQGLFLFRLDYMYYGTKEHPIATPIVKPHYHLHYDNVKENHIFLQ